MKKLTYSTPVVEVTKWSSQDVITTSGLVKESSYSLAVSNVGDNNVTATVDFTDIK